MYAGLKERHPIVNSQFSIILEDLGVVLTNFFSPGAWFRLFGDV